MKQGIMVRTARYAAALGTGTAAGSLMAAPAAISPQTFIMQEQSANNYTIYELWDVDGDAVNDFVISGFYDVTSGDGYLAIYDYGGYPYNGVIADYQSNGGGWPDYSVTPLPGGTVVDNGDSFYPNGSALYEQRNSGTFLFQGFSTGANLGMLFDIPGNSPYYGCALVEVSDTNNDGAPDVQVLSGVYEDVSGQPVTCAAEPTEPMTPTAVPVSAAAIPASLGLLVLGAAYARRRRKS